MPCQDFCFKEYDQPFASIISECKLRGKARSRAKDTFGSPQPGAWVTSSSCGWYSTRNGWKWSSSEQGCLGMRHSYSWERTQMCQSTSLTCTGVCPYPQSAMQRHRESFSSSSHEHGGEGILPQQTKGEAEPTCTSSFKRSRKAWLKKNSRIPHCVPFWETAKVGRTCGITKKIARSLRKKMGRQTLHLWQMLQTSVGQTSGGPRTEHLQTSFLWLRFMKQNPEFVLLCWYRSKDWLWYSHYICLAMSPCKSRLLCCQAWRRNHSLGSKKRLAITACSISSTAVPQQAWGWKNELA